MRTQTLSRSAVVANIKEATRSSYSLSFCVLRLRLSSLHRFHAPVLCRGSLGASRDTHPPTREQTVPGQRSAADIHTSSRWVLAIALIAQAQVERFAQPRK